MPLVTEGTDLIAMNMTTASKEMAGDLPAATHCRHCGEELAPEGEVYADGYYFCCTGCSTVYGLLNSLGLDNFYKIREEQNIGRIPRPIDPESDSRYEYLNQENFISLYAVPGSPRSMEFYIEGINCGACLWLIEKISAYSDYIDSVTLDMSTNIAAVVFTEEKKFSSFPEMAKRLGYRAHPIKAGGEAADLRRRENRKTLIRLAVAAVCAGNIMLLSASIYSGADGTFAEYFGILNLLLSIPVVTYCAYPFYKSVAASLRTGRLTTDLPVAFVTAAGFSLSAYSLLRGGTQVYFDSIALFVFLILASRYALKSVQDRVTDNIPISSYIFNRDRILARNESDGHYYHEPVESIKPGRTVKVVNGDRIPVDGILLSDNADLNLSVLTGESIPHKVLRHGDIFAGSVLESEEAVIEVTNSGNSTRIGKIIEGVERNYRNKIRNTSGSERFASIFTLTVAAVALAAFVAISVTLGSAAALSRVMAFVLIACPCAFVFAFPLAQAMSLKSALRSGIVVRSHSVFEKLPEIKNIFFDKTGSLTTGVFRIVKWETGELMKPDLEAIVSIEKESSHPVARAIVSRLGGTGLTLREVLDFRQIHTRGVSAYVDGDFYELVAGTADKDTGEEAAIITTKIIVRKNGRAVSEIFLGDTLKKEAAPLVRTLQQRGYNVFILSGDKYENVKEAGEKLGVPENNLYWQKTPEEKAEITGTADNTMMVGDGLNDTAAFSRSDLSVSVQGSVRESLEISDAYILDNSLSNILDLIRLGDRAKSIKSRNSVFSVGYNAAAGALALLGYIDPLAAAVLMPLSSLLLIGSSVYGQKISRARIKDGAA